MWVEFTNVEAATRTETCGDLREERLETANVLEHKTACGEVEELVARQRPLGHTHIELGKRDVRRIGEPRACARQHRASRIARHNTLCSRRPQHGVFARASAEFEHARTC